MKRLMIMFLSVAVFCSVRPACAESLRVAVVEFTEKGSAGVPDAGAIVAEWMVSSLGKLDKYQLTERVLLKKILDEQKLGQSGLIDGKTAAKIGKLYGVDAIVSGSVMAWGDIISITARLISTENGSIISSGDVKATDKNAVALQIDRLAHMLAGVEYETTAPAYRSDGTLTTERDAPGQVTFDFRSGTLVGGLLRSVGLSGTKVAILLDKNQVLTKDFSEQYATVEGVPPGSHLLEIRGLNNRQLYLKSQISVQSRRTTNVVVDYSPKYLSLRSANIQ